MVACNCFITDHEVNSLKTIQLKHFHSLLLRYGAFFLTEYMLLQYIAMLCMSYCAAHVVLLVWNK